MTFAATLVAAHNHAQRELEHRWILPKEDRPRVIPDDNEIKVVSAERERLGKTLAGRLA